MFNDIIEVQKQLYEKHLLLNTAMGKYFAPSNRSGTELFNFLVMKQARQIVNV